MALGSKATTLPLACTLYDENLVKKKTMLIYVYSAQPKHYIAM